jgi:hypothetical protein
MGSQDDGQSMARKVRCASALARISWELPVAQKLANSGGLSALTLLLSVDDPELQEVCAVGLANLSHDSDVAKLMIDTRSMKPIIILSNEGKSSLSLFLFSSQQVHNEPNNHVGLYIQLHTHR